jgi:hypothetical protein
MSGEINLNPVNIPQVQPASELEQESGLLNDFIVEVCEFYDSTCAPFINTAKKIREHATVTIAEIGCKMYEPVSKLYDEFEKYFPKAPKDPNETKFSFLPDLAKLKEMIPPWAMKAAKEGKGVFQFIFIAVEVGSIASTFGGFIHKNIDDLNALNSDKIMEACLMASVAMGSLLDIPGKVIDAVSIFTTLPAMPWTTILSSVALFFSAASIFLALKSHSETSDVMDELERNASIAILNQLRVSVQNANFLNVVGSVTPDELMVQIDDIMHKIGSPDEVKDFPAAVANLVKLANAIDPNIVKELEIVGKKAYLECVAKYDDDFLEKHFRMGGETIKSAIDAINSSNEPQELKDLHTLLSARISDKQFSDKMTILIDTVSLVAATLFLILEFGLICSPLAPIGYALAIAAGLMAITKIIVEYQINKMDNEEINRLVSSVKEKNAISAIRDSEEGFEFTGDEIPDGALAEINRIIQAKQEVKTPEVKTFDAQKIDDAVEGIKNVDYEAIAILDSRRIARVVSSFEDDVEREFFFENREEVY